MSKKHRKVSRALNYIDHLPIVISIFTRGESISVFAYLVGIPIGITSSAIELKICVVTARFEKYKSIIKKKNHDKIVLLTKSKSNGIEVLISKALIKSNISHDEFVLINNVLKEFYDMKEGIKNSNDK